MKPVLLELSTLDHSDIFKCILNLLNSWWSQSNI